MGIRGKRKERHELIWQYAGSPSHNLIGMERQAWGSQIWCHNLHILYFRLLLNVPNLQLWGVLVEDVLAVVLYGGRTQLDFSR